MPDLALTIGQVLRQRQLTLAVAESCTGGLLGHRLTDIPGASAYFLGGVIAYAYSAKERLLGVSADTLAHHGAVSEATARAMARGARQALGADLALAITGIAGPDGGLPGKPVGLTWIGLSAAEAELARRFVWAGDRPANKALSAEAALRLLAEHLGLPAAEG